MKNPFRLLPSAYCLLPTAFCLLPSAFCLLPSAFCLLPSAFCLLLKGHAAFLSSLNGGFAAAAICSLLMSLTPLANPSNSSTRMPYQLISISYQVKPCLAARGCAWWLLCQPSPKDNIATHQLFLESSVVSNR